MKSEPRLPNNSLFKAYLSVYKISCCVSTSGGETITVDAQNNQIVYTKSHAEDYHGECCSLYSIMAKNVLEQVNVGIRFMPAQYILKLLKYAKLLNDCSYSTSLRGLHNTLRTIAPHFSLIALMWGDFCFVFILSFIKLTNLLISRELLCTHFNAENDIKTAVLPSISRGMRRLSHTKVKMMLS